MLPARLVYKRCWSPQLQQMPMVSPEGTQDGSRMPTNSPVTAASSPPTERPEETRDVKTGDTGPR